MFEKLKSFYESNALQWLKEGRALFYQPTDNTGFGNKIRGLVGSFIFCLVTRRFLFMADEFLHYFLLSPFQFSWLPQDYPQSRKLAKNAYHFIPPFRPDNWSEEFWQILCNQKIDDVPTPKPVLWYAESTAPYNALLINPWYQSFFETLGMDPRHRMQTIVQISSFLLSRFRKVWLDEMNKVCAKNAIEINSTSQILVGVQFRSFIDVREISESEKVYKFENFVSNLKNVIETKVIKSHSVVSFFITTDNQEFRKTLVQILQPYGAVTTSSKDVVLTGGNYQEKKTLFQKIYKKVKSKIEDYFFPLRPPKLELRKLFVSDNFCKKKVGKKANSIIDWLILGECDVIISTFTTYSIFAAARRGNRAKLFKVDPYHQIVSELNNENYDV